MNTQNSLSNEETLFQIDKEQFGIFISELRKEKGYTQKELAQKLFISDKAISKWERGLSMPDISLLIPLSEVLEVSVTELLKYQRLEQTEKLNAEQIDEIIRKAIQISEERPLPKFPSRKTWICIDMIAAFILLIEFAVLFTNTPLFTLEDNSLILLRENLLVGIVLGCIFSVISLFLKGRLPDYYDLYKISHVGGFFRIQLSGVSINNSNYPYIIFALRIWSVAMMTIYPLIYVALSYILGTIWTSWEEAICLIIILGSMFVPLYVIAKKFE